VTAFKRLVPKHSTAAWPPVPIARDGRQRHGHYWAPCCTLRYGCCIRALVTAFIWLADRYSPLTAGLIVFGPFAALAVIGVVVAISAHRAAAASAEKALAKQSTLALVQPTHLKTALQVASGIGWRRVVPVVGVGFLAAGLVRELSMRRRINRDAAY
jgi:hypothetical protein